MRKGWATKKLSEVFELKPPKSEAKSKLKNSDSVTFLPMEDLGIMEKNILPSKERKLQDVVGSYTYFAENDVLLAKITPCFENGKLGIARNLKNGIGFGSSEYIVFRNQGEIIPEYLFYFLSREQFRAEGKMAMSGAVGHKRVSKDFIENYLITYPESLSEQKRIVEILDRVFTAIDKAKANLEKNLQNAKELFESYLQNIYINKGEDWAHESLETLLEKGWITSHLDGNHGSEYPRKEEFKSSGVPYISANCIKGTAVDFSLSKYLTLERSQTIRKGIAINNDVLFAHNATVGPVALLKTKEPKVILGTSLTYYRCNTQFILPEYLAHYMRSKDFKRQYELVMRQSTRNQVPITKQREFYHIIPTIETQKALIKTLEVLLEHSQKLEICYEKKIENLETLRKSILGKAFIGELKSKAVLEI